MILYQSIAYFVPRKPKNETNSLMTDTDNTRKHIAFVIDSLAGGGAERAGLTLIQKLLKKNYEIDLVLVDFRGPRLLEIPKSVKLFVLDRKFPRQIKLEKCSISYEHVHWVEPPFTVVEKAVAWFQFSKALNWPNRKFRSTRKNYGYMYRATAMARYMVANKPDIIFALLTESHLASLIGRRISASTIPIICSVRNALEFDMAFQRKPALKYLYSEADRIHTVSNGLATSFLNQFPDVSGKLIAIYNPTYRPEIAVLALQPPIHSWLASNAPNNICKGSTNVILAAGKFELQKNFSMLLRSFAKVHKKRNVRLIILGDGKERQNLENLANQLDIAESVSMPGWVKNPYAFMAQARLFVLSSSWEGLPGVLIEALACGCPIVSTDCQHGPREILQHGQWGKLVPTNNPDALTDAIVASLSEVPDRKSLKRRALQFSSENLMDEYENLIRHTISENLSFVDIADDN